MEASVVTAKGQIVIPTRMRRKYGIKKGMKIAFVEHQGKLILQPLNKDYFANLAGVFGTKGKLLRSLIESKKKERKL